MSKLSVTCRDGLRAPVFVTSQRKEWFGMTRILSVYVQVQLDVNYVTNIFVELLYDGGPIIPIIYLLALHSIF